METCKPSLRERICPLPRRVEYTEGAGLELRRGCGWAVESALGFELADTARELLEERLEALLGPAGTGSPALTVTLGLGEAPEGAEHADQGYRLELGDGKAVLTGFGEHGLLYAAVSLRQLLTLDNGAVQIPHAIVLDWPALKLRGQKSESRYGTNLMELQDWKDMIDDFLDHKINLAPVALYGCWCVQYDGQVSEYLYFPVKGHPELKTPVAIKYFSPKENRWIMEEKLPPMFEQDFFEELVRYGKARGVMVYPMINSYGHNTLIPANIPEISAKEEDGTPTLTGFCTANPKTYELLFSILDQLIDNYMTPYGVNHLSLGLDEVRPEPGFNAQDPKRIRSPWCSCEKCRGQEKKDIFLNHVKTLMKYVHSKGVKNIHMACDMLINRASAAIGHLSGELCEMLAREGLTDSVMVGWWTYHDLEENMYFKTTHPELNMRGITAPWNGYYHWIMLTNPLRNNRIMTDLAMKENKEGSISYAIWDRSYDRTQSLFAEYAWAHDDAGDIPDVVGRYIARRFPSQADQARRAFELVDLITEERVERLDGSHSAVVSNYHMLLSRLSYYFYSYVKVDKPYPRIFPGEALARICEHRDDHRRAIAGIASMALEARGLFEEIARDARCDTAMAARFAYECDNYLCLARDYLALFDMMRLAESGDPCRLARIRDMARGRKQARLDLMRRLEDTKEPYLTASALRNHSIFMQFFADLERYLAETPAGEVRLDFFDMRDLASPEFMSLR